MEVDRRTLMKGALAGGALLALGVPARTFAASPPSSLKSCLLFLGGTLVDDAFERGASAACAEAGGAELRRMKLQGGLCAHPDHMLALLEASRDVRWISVMDDADAAIFQELARTTGVRLLSRGSHSCTEDGARSLRHVWLSASASHSAGELLAARLHAEPDGFSITERFLEPPANDDSLEMVSLPGFASYRSAGPERLDMHCSGITLAEACAFVGWPTSGVWSPVVLTSPKGSADTPHPESWVEAVGHAVTAAALGTGQVARSTSGHAFVRGSFGSAPIRPAGRFVSFVMDR